MWNRNEKSWRPVSALFVSTGIHILFLLGILGLEPKSTAPSHRVDAIQRNPAVNVSIATPKTFSPPKIPSAAPVKKVSSARNVIARHEIPHEEIPQEPQVAQQESSTQSNSSGVAFLPSTGALTRFLPGAESRGRWQEEGYASSSEGHKSEGNAAEQAASGAKLNPFAESFEEHFLLPKPLRQYTILAQAEAEVARVTSTDTESAAQWQVWTLRGEPYFRALLYETLLAFLPTPAARESLKDFSPSRFVVALDYQKSKSGIPRDLEKSRQFFGVQFTLTLRDFEVDEKWAVPTVSMQESGALFTGINLVGSLDLIAKKVAPVDPFKSSAMETLRRSPGFSLQGNIQSQLPGR